jgi:hypothetical protein
VPSDQRCAEWGEALAAVLTGGTDIGGSVSGSGCSFSVVESGDFGIEVFHDGDEWVQTFDPDEAEFAETRSLVQPLNVEGAQVAVYAQKATADGTLLNDEVVLRLGDVWVHVSTLDDDLPFSFEQAQDMATALVNT